MTGFQSKQDMAAGKQKEYDPCPGCIVGTVCRTPNCGRLKLPVDHPFRNTKAALIASIIACREMLDAQPVPARKYAPTDPFERWWYYESIGTPNDEHTKRMCQIAWSNGAYLAAQPAQEPVAHLWECLGRWSAYLVENGKQADCAPPSWLVDAINKATTPPLPAQEPVEYQMLILGGRWTHCAKHIYDAAADKSIVRALYATPPKRERVLFPTMLRKMWSGGEVQAWLDENVNKEKNNG